MKILCMGCLLEEEKGIGVKGKEREDVLLLVVEVDECLDIGCFELTPIFLQIRPHPLHFLANLHVLLVVVR